MSKYDRVDICGGGEFIGEHLIAQLPDEGYTNLRSVDIQPQSWWFQRFRDVENLILDLQNKDNCYRALQGAVWVLKCAADMGGIVFIEMNKVLCMLNVLINTHLLMAARDMGVRRAFSIRMTVKH